MSVQIAHLLFRVHSGLLWKYYITTVRITVGPEDLNSV